MFSQYTNGTSALILGALKFVLGHLTTFLYPGVYHNYARGGKTCNKYMYATQLERQRWWPETGWLGGGGSMVPFSKRKKGSIMSMKYDDDEHNWARIHVLLVTAACDKLLLHEMGCLIVGRFLGWRNKSLPMISNEQACYTDSVTESETFVTGYFSYAVKGAQGTKVYTKGQCHFDSISSHNIQSCIPQFRPV